MPKYKLLTRIGDNRDEIQWNDYDVNEYVTPPATLLNNILNENELNNALSPLFDDGKSVYYNMYSFKRSINPPSSINSTVRIDNNPDGTPIYAWLSDESSSDVLYYTEADKIIIDSGYNLFGSLANCREIDVDIFDTSNVTTMKQMFYNCALQSIDVSNFDTSNVTDMSNMFNGCDYYLTSLDLSNFDTSNVTDMRGMFGLCSSLNSLNVSNFNTSNVTDISYMFQYCNQLTSLDISNFNTSNVTNMSYMFGYCSKLTSLDLSNFNTSNVTNMNNMFRDCTSLTTIICTSEIEQWIRDNATAMVIPNIDNITFNRP